MCFSLVHQGAWPVAVLNTCSKFIICLRLCSKGTGSRTTPGPLSRCGRTPPSGKASNSHATNRPERQAKCGGNLRPERSQFPTRRREAIFELGQKQHCQESTGQRLNCQSLVTLHVDCTAHQAYSLRALCNRSIDPQPGQPTCPPRIPIFNNHGSTDTAPPGTNCGPVEAVTLLVAEVNNSQIPRPHGRGPFISRARSLDAGYSLTARATRVEPLETPSGSRTRHWLWLSSTWREMDASQGGWSGGDSTRAKSGPRWVMRREVSGRTSRILTWAECAP